MNRFQFTIKGIVIFIAILFSVSYLGNILATVEKNVNIYKAEDCDVVFVGSSHIYRGINPQLIYDETGITSVNIASSSQDIKGSYWLLKSYLRQHNPQAAIVELPTWFAGARETYALWNISENDILKYLSYFDLKNENFDMNDASRFLAFRTEYGAIDKGDFDYLSGKGFLKSDRWYNAIYSDTNVISQKEVDERYRSDDVVDENDIIKYVDKIIKLAQNKDIAIVFINTPALTSRLQDIFYEKMEKNLLSKGVTILNYADINSGRSDFDLETDFSDQDHLSYVGGTKLTLKLCDYLVNGLNLSHDTHKGEDKSWEENKLHYQYTYELKNYKKESLVNYLQYADNLPEDYIQLIVFDEEAYNKCSDEVKDILREYGINDDQYEYTNYAIIYRRGEVFVSQEYGEAELYHNFDGTSFYLRSNENGSVIRGGKSIQRGESGTVLTAVYVASYNDFIFSTFW